VSIVELDPQALLIVGTLLSKNGVVFVVMSGERQCLWASCFTRTDMYWLFI